MTFADVEKVRDGIVRSRCPQHGAAPRRKLRLKLRQQPVEIFYCIGLDIVSGAAQALPLDLRARTTCPFHRALQRRAEHRCGGGMRKRARDCFAIKTCCHETTLPPKSRPDA